MAHVCRNPILSPKSFLFRTAAVLAVLLQCDYLLSAASAAAPRVTIPDGAGWEAESTALLRQAPGLGAHALATAVATLRNLLASGVRVRSDVLALIDYSLPSWEPRLWVFDLRNNRLLFHELVAQGKNSGDVYATRFSNAPGSLMSSLGAYLTGGTYMGKHGLSLRLIGLEKGVNDNVASRDIVLHSASYVSEKLAQKGRIGRSWGCPAVRPEVVKPLIQAIQGGALLLAYHPSLPSPAQP
jgi:hypothetical protein